MDLPKVKFVENDINSTRFKVSFEYLMCLQNSDFNDEKLVVNTNEINFDCARITQFGIL